MYSSLEDARKDAETTLVPLVELDRLKDHGTFLVVLREPDPIADEGGLIYHCIRYFTLGDHWHYSIDGDMVELDAVWSWLNKPQAWSTREEGYVKLEPVA